MGQEWGRSGEGVGGTEGGLGDREWRRNGAVGGGVWEECARSEPWVRSGGGVGED